MRVLSQSTLKTSWKQGCRWVFLNGQMRNLDNKLSRRLQQFLYSVFYHGSVVRMKFRSWTGYEVAI